MNVGGEIVSTVSSSVDSVSLEIVFTTTVCVVIVRTDARHETYNVSI